MKKYIAFLLACFMCLSVFQINSVYAADILVTEENLESMSEKNDYSNEFQSEKVLEQKESEHNSSIELNQNQEGDDSNYSNHIEQEYTQNSVLDQEEVSSIEIMV